MTGMRRMAWLLLALPSAAALCCWVGPAQAAGRTIVIQDGVNGPELVPAALTVAPGDTVSFLNNSSYPLGYDVAVAHAGKVEYSENIGFGAAGAGHWTAPATAGVRTVTATQTVTGTAAKGTVTVASPQVGSPPSSSPTRSSEPSPSSSPVGSPRRTPGGASPTATRARGPSTGSSAAPRGTAAPFPTVTLGAMPSVSVVTPAPGSDPLLAGSPQPLPVGSKAVARGPLEQPTGRAQGLPAALAAVLVGGTAAAYVRVLLAEPVDDDGGTVGSGR